MLHFEAYIFHAVGTYMYVMYTCEITLRLSTEDEKSILRFPEDKKNMQDETHNAVY